MAEWECKADCETRRSLVEKRIPDANVAQTCGEMALTLAMSGATDTITCPIRQMGGSE